MVSTTDWPSVTWPNTTYAYCESRFEWSPRLMKNSQVAVFLEAKSLCCPERAIATEYFEFRRPENSQSTVAVSAPRPPWMTQSFATRWNPLLLYFPALAREMKWPA